MAIRFGTSGWRAIIADEFTFEKVRLVTEAICSYLKESSGESQQTIVIGHDSRFMGERFSEVAAEIAKKKDSKFYYAKIQPQPQRFRIRLETNRLLAG